MCARWMGAKCAASAGIAISPRFPTAAMRPPCRCLRSSIQKFGAVAGTLAGFFIDAVGSIGLSLSPLLYCVFGYVTGICAEFLFRRGVLSFTMATVVSYFLRGFATIILVAASWTTYSTTFVFLRVVLPEIALSILFSYPVYLAFRLLAGRFHRDFELKN